MNMTRNFEDLLHARIIKHCKKLVDDEHFKHAAREAMTQVELALKEKTGVKSMYGVNLIKKIFGQGQSIKLRIPFGEELQKEAESLFRGAFSYYRNYAAHDGAKIDRSACLRILIVASELLELIGASDRSFADIGGIRGLIQTGIFKDKSQIHNLLIFLNDQVLPDHVCDGFYEDLKAKGGSNSQFQAILDLGFVEYLTEPYTPSEFESAYDAPEELGIFRLTESGSTFLNELESHK